MIPVVTAAEMRALDRETIDGLGLPGLVLMENAGRAVAREARRLLAARAARGCGRVVIACGAGNNGGDGFVAARALVARGVDTRLLLCASPARLRGEAQAAYEVARRLGLAIEVAESEAEVTAAADRLFAAADVIVDALLGTGLERDVAGPLRTCIERMNRAPAARLAVDLPSGLSADTGRPLGLAVAADVTVTLAFPKVGVASWPGVEHTGRVRIAEIGIPRALAERQGIRLHLVERGDVAPLLPRRAAGGHKGTYGHVLCVAGSAGKTGAALLCAEGAARAGAGLVTIASSAATVRAFEGRVREVMCADLGPDDALGDAASMTRLGELLAGKAAVCVGPGVPRSEGMWRTLLRLVEHAEVPLVIDADGLNLLADHPVEARRALAARRAPTLLTPHPGEAARLAGSTVAEIQADRIAAARRLARELAAHVVLKGARSVIAEPGGAAWINPTGTPAMATGGVGDVLTGVVGALAAQHLPAGDALRLGVYAHGRAGERAARGRTSVLASEVAEEVPHLLATLRGA